MENKRSKNDKVSRRKQKAVEAKAGKIGVAKIKEEEKKEEEENKIKEREVKKEEEQKKKKKQEKVK